MKKITGFMETCGSGLIVIQASILNIVTYHEERQLKKMLKRIQKSNGGKGTVKVEITVLENEKEENVQ